MSWISHWFEKQRSRRDIDEGYSIAFVVVIITVFLVIIYRQESSVAERAKCAHNLRQLTMAYGMFMEEHDGVRPSQEDWVTELAPYVDRLSVFFCPSDGEGRVDSAERRKMPTVSYWYIPPSPSPESAGSVPFMGDRMYSILSGNHDDGGNVAYPDGHIRWVTSDDWNTESLPVERYKPRRHFWNRAPARKP